MYTSYLTADCDRRIPGRGHKPYGDIFHRGRRKPTHNIGETTLWLKTQKIGACKHVYTSYLTADRDRRVPVGARSSVLRCPSNRTTSLITVFPVPTGKTIRRCCGQSCAVDPVDTSISSACRQASIELACSTTMSTNSCCFSLRNAGAPFRAAETASEVSAWLSLPPFRPRQLRSKHACPLPHVPALSRTRIFALHFC